DVVHLEPELHRQTALFRGQDRVDVLLDVIDAALHVIRHRPERTRLPEVVDVLGEADLVDVAGARSLDERLYCRGFMRDFAAAVTEVHVVIDDHTRDTIRVHPETRYATSGGYHIAYQVVGNDRAWTEGRSGAGGPRPAASDTEAVKESFTRMMRLSASPGAATALARMAVMADVRDILPSIRCPTLVLVREGDENAPASR